MNSVGFQTLFAKETRRFLRVPGQTLAQPIVTTALYFLVFGYALGGRVREVDGVSYIRFIVPGLMLLGLSQNAFLNTSSSMFIAKMQGTIVDLLVAPLGVVDLLMAFILAAVLRGLLVGGIVWAISALFTGFHVSHPVWVVVFALLVGATFGLIGLVVAIWSDKFEQLNIVPTFIITPLTFLGGVFYSANMLPRPWSYVSRVNPVLYMVEGLRYGVVGTSTSSPWLGLAVTGGIAVAVAGDRDLDARDRLQAAQLVRWCALAGAACIARLVPITSIHRFNAPPWSCAISTISWPASSTAASPRRRGRFTSRNRRCRTRLAGWSARWGCACWIAGRAMICAPRRRAACCWRARKMRWRAVTGFAADLAALQGLARGQLMVASIQSLNATLLPAPIARFVARYPGVALGVRTHPAEAIAQAVRHGGEEIGFVAGAPPETLTGLSVRRLYQERFVAIIHKSDPLARRRKIAMAALRERALALVPAGTYTATVVHSACERAGFVPRVAVTLDSGEGLREIVRAGKLITILPERYLPKNDDRLSAVALTDPTPTRDVFALRNPARLGTRAADTFLSLVEAHVSERR